jgi:hypothetical protein
MSKYFQYIAGEVSFFDAIERYREIEEFVLMMH